MKKYTTPLLAQYAIATEADGNEPQDSQTCCRHAEWCGCRHFREAIFDLGDDYSDGQADDLDFNSTGIF